MNELSGFGSSSPHSVVGTLMGPKRGNTLVFWNMYALVRLWHQCSGSARVVLHNIPRVQQVFSANAPSCSEFSGHFFVVHLVPSFAGTENVEKMRVRSVEAGIR